MPIMEGSLRVTGLALLAYGSTLTSMRLFVSFVQADYQDLELDLTDQPFLILASDGIWELIGVDVSTRRQHTILSHSSHTRFSRSFTYCATGSL